MDKIELIMYIIAIMIVLIGIYIRINNYNFCMTEFNNLMYCVFR